MSSNPKHSPFELIGQWHRFGAEGPAYEVIGNGTEPFRGRPTMRIRVLHDSEELDYPLDDIMNDPQAE